MCMYSCISRIQIPKLCHHSIYHFIIALTKIKNENNEYGNDEFGIEHKFPERDKSFHLWQNNNAKT